ncbi:unnamed protein product [Adineta steineri]|uniref:Uncharacterized protein n=1 Tax=Adineta steineri TaxID=433720 RepID=A0A814SUB8_9BILA|nr:unnamed protein product [Adineta steineri]CAF1340183.1 unnamed protein product [Adineta steineri]
MFSRQTFGINTDRMRRKRLGQITTRLYIVLLIIGHVILILHVIIQPQILTKTFDQPSLTTYNRLMVDHSDTLQCPCSSISSIYDRYVIIEPVFHQVCSSPFSSDHWRDNVTADLVPDVSVYDARDYRRFLSAHLQCLTGLCNLSIQSVNNSIGQLLSSLYITTQLQSPIAFQTHIDSMVQQSKSAAPAAFARLLSILRATNHGNAIISSYGTNFKYYFPRWFGTKFVLGTYAL